MFVRRLSKSPCEHLNTLFNHTRRDSYHRASISAKILQGHQQPQTLNLHNTVLTLIIAHSVLACEDAIQKYGDLNPRGVERMQRHPCTRPYFLLSYGVLLEGLRLVNGLYRGSLYLTKLSAMRTDPF